MFKLNRTDEIALIQLGMKTLLDREFNKPKIKVYKPRYPKAPKEDKPKKKKRTISVEARKKISKRMKQYWAEQKRG